MHLLQNFKNAKGSLCTSFILAYVSSGFCHNVGWNLRKIESLLILDRSLTINHVLMHLISQLTWFKGPQPHWKVPVNWCRLTNGQNKVISLTRFAKFGFCLEATLSTLFDDMTGAVSYSTFVGENGVIDNYCHFRLESNRKLLVPDWIWYLSKQNQWAYKCCGNFWKLL